MIRLNDTVIPVQLFSGLYRVPVCSKSVWDRLKRCRTDDEYITVCGMLLEGVPLSAYDCRMLAKVYISSLERLREETDLKIPEYKTDQTEHITDEVKYKVYTRLEKLAADYANMNIYEIDDLPITEYWLLVRDAFIDRLSETKKGREYLNNAYRITQTEADEDIDI